MAEPSLALQKVIAARLLGDAEIMEAIGPDGILDTIGRPERERCILIGQSQAVYRGEIATVYSTLHVWIKEPGLRLAKEVVGAVVDAVSFDAQIARQYIDADDFTIADISVNDTRFIPDPDQWSHGVVNVQAIMREVA
jgi:hypothetical protein